MSGVGPGQNFARLGHVLADLAGEFLHRGETALAAQGVSLCGKDYFTGLSTGDYRVTWIDADGTVLFDTGADASRMENHLEREEIRQALTQVRKDVREKIEQAAAPKAAVTCPYCGATTTPDASGCCEYCGGAVNG